MRLKSGADTAVGLLEIFSGHGYCVFERIPWHFVVLLGSARPYL